MGIVPKLALATNPQVARSSRARRANLLVPDRIHLI